MREDECITCDTESTRSDSFRRAVWLFVSSFEYDESWSKHQNKSDVCVAMLAVQGEYRSFLEMA